MTQLLAIEKMVVKPEHWVSAELLRQQPGYRECNQCVMAVAASEHFGKPADVAISFLSLGPDEAYILDQTGKDIVLAFDLHKSSRGYYRNKETEVTLTFIKPAL